ncbi:increased DNA methylation 3 isoform X1 [Trifolium pratense]|nr:increased DNA methylation 3 isoform X1 [Trifolium pratense]
MDFKAKNLCYKRKSLTIKPTNNNVVVVSDRKFLIDFIFTTYLGPDVKSDNPRCSSLQRLITGLPPYNFNDLGSSYVTISLLEKLYYYLVKNAVPEVILDLNMFHMYLKGKLDLPGSEFLEGSQQFTSIFPLDLHPQIWYPDSFRIVKGVVLIDDPIVSSCVKEEDLNRFRLLTGVGSLKLDLSECLCFRIDPRLSKESDSGCVDKLLETSPNERCKESDGDCVNKLSKESESDCVNKLLESSPNEGCKESDGDCVNKLNKESDGDCVNKLLETSPNEGCKESDSDCVNKLSKENDSDCVNKLLESSPNEGYQSGKFREECKRKYDDVDVDDTPSMSEFPHTATTNGDPSFNKMCESDGPSMMPLLSIPDIDDCVQDSSVVLTGTANRGLLGPSVGVVDIGISKAAYLFRVSLPGVKREYNQFSCDIESDGKVEIKGLLSGGRTIEKQSRIFQMKTQQLCSPGPFTVSFSLPGPVDPRLFAPNFRSDGIFEGVVIKL